MNIDILLTGIQYGLITAIVSFGVMIPFRLLDFPDLTAEGAYPLGGAVCAVLLSNNIPMYLCIITGSLCGGIAGIITAQVALRLNVDSLLSGIITSTMLYSINQRIMGKPSVALFNLHLPFGMFATMLIIIFVLISFSTFLRTDYGLRFRALGLNPLFAAKYNISKNRYISLGLLISGSIFGLAGSIVVIVQKFMDIGLGIGIVIHALASLMLGEALIGSQSLNKQLLAPIIGALIYQQLIGIAFWIGLAPSDLKLFTGIIVLLILGLSKK